MVVVASPVVRVSKKSITPALVSWRSTALPLVEEARALLNSREARKQELHRENEHIFTFMHRIFGRRIIELFDEFDDLEDEDAEGKD